MPHHTKRDSLTGFDRARLRRHIEQSMGVKSNSDIFASKGDPWETTAKEEERTKRIRERLEQHLREAKPNEQAFIAYVRARLDDSPGPVSRPMWDKQSVAREDKQRRNRTDTRAVHDTTMKAVRQKVTRLAALEQERKNHDGRKGVRGKEFGHFTMEVL